MLLSSVVQMKNSLIKCLEHEAKEQNPDHKMWTQVPIIENLNPESSDAFYQEDDEGLTLYTPKDVQYET